VHTVADSERSLPLPFNSLAPSSPAYAWWGKIFSDARTLTCYPDIRFEIADTEDKESQVSRGKGSFHKGSDQTRGKAGNGRCGDDMMEAGLAVHDA